MIARVEADRDEKYIVIQRRADKVGHVDIDSDTMHGCKE
jgi:hypothetical protein